MGDLCYNELTGSIPAEIGALINLLFLDLSSNKLTGSIPVEIGALVNLQRFGLISNQLSGLVPPELVTSLQGANLDLSYNDFLYLEGVSKPERWRMEGCGLRAPP